MAERRAHTVAALLLLSLTCSCAMGGSDRLGRLLTSPEERRFIADRARMDEGRADAMAAVRFEGAMRAEDGRLALWINGHRYDDPDALRRLGLVLSDDSVLPPRVALLTHDKRVVYLRPGQMYDPATGDVTEMWQRMPVERDQADRPPAQPSLAVAERQSRRRP